MPTIPLAPWWRRLRQSRTLVVTVVFIAMMLDLITLTTLEPILPDILYLMENPELSNGKSNNISRHNNATVIRGQTAVTHKVGIILATKPGVEILANIVVGFVVHRYGHKYPMVIGCVANFIATLGFAFANRFYMFIIARVVQAFGSSLSVVSGLALLATVFTDEDERSRVTGIALGGLSLGIIVGFPFGSTLYQFVCREAPFLLLAGLIVFDGALRMLIYIPRAEITGGKTKLISSMTSLLLDPYILIALGCNFMQHVGLGMVIATEAAWMLETLKAQQWQIGVVLVSGAFLQFGVQYLTGAYSTRIGRWLFCVLGLILSSIGYMMYPFCTSIWMVLGPENLCRIGLGMVTAVLTPLLGYIVDIRHNSNYGPIYGLYAASYNMGLVIGPVTGGILLNKLGFAWLYRGTAVLVFLYSWICIVFRNMEPKNLLQTTKDGLEPCSRSQSYGTFSQSLSNSGRFFHRSTPIYRKMESRPKMISVTAPSLTPYPPISLP